MWIRRIDQSGHPEQINDCTGAVFCIAEMTDRAELLQVMPGASEDPTVIASGTYEEVMEAERQLWNRSIHDGTAYYMDVTGKSGCAVNLHKPANQE